MTSAKRSTYHASQKANREIEVFVSDFVRRVSDLPQVRQVRADTSAGYPRICTVIHSKPFADSYREAVYRIELESMDAHPEVPVDFDLVNIAEYPEALADEILPTGFQVRLTRSGSAR